MISFLLFFHWKALYKNVYKGLHKRIENNWNSRSSRPCAFCTKSVLRNFAKFTGKHLHQSFLLNKVVGLKPVTLLKKRPWNRSFPVHFAKFLRTPFLVEHLQWLSIGPFLGCQSIWYFSRNTKFSRMNIIFFADAGDVTLMCIFSGQGHACNAYAYIQKIPYFQRSLIKIIFFHFPTKEKIPYFLETRNTIFPDVTKMIVFRCGFLGKTIFSEHLKKISYLQVFFWGRSSFLLCLKSKIIFSGKINIIFPDNTRKIIFQCNFFERPSFQNIWKKKILFFVHWCLILHQQVSF